MKNYAIPALVIVILLLIGMVIYKFSDEKVIEGNNPTPQELMSLSVYIQDKEAAETSDCGITKMVTHQIPKTTGVADASLRILFAEELSRYGIYDSVTIKNGVANVMLKSDLTPEGKPIGSLSSCEVRHLQAVLRDTLTQYESIKTVELSVPEGKVEF